MERIRVWLHSWEWNCCGDPFTVGDTVTLNVDRGPDAWLRESVGAELASTIDAVESHHEDGGGERLAGTVAAVRGVALEYTETRMPRPPRPDGLTTPPRIALSGGGWSAVRPDPQPYVVVSEMVPDSARLVDVPRVPWPPRESEPEYDGQARPAGLTGYLVDFEIG